MAHLQHFFATILESDFTNGDAHFDCLFISKTEAAARTKKDWTRGKTLRRRDVWDATQVDNNNITVTFVPTNEKFAAKIYKMIRKA